jgi:hypothetical protein
VNIFSQNVIAPDSDQLIKVTPRVQRLFNSIDDNAILNQSISHLDVGHEVDSVAKAHSFENLPTNEYGRECFPL